MAPEYDTFPGKLVAPPLCPLPTNDSLTFQVRDANETRKFHLASGQIAQFGPAMFFALWGAWTKGDNITVELMDSESATTGVGIPQGTNFEFTQLPASGLREPQPPITTKVTGYAIWGRGRAGVVLVVAVGGGTQAPVYAHDASTLIRFVSVLSHARLFDWSVRIASEKAPSDRYATITDIEFAL